MADKLKPCPFCGGKAEIERHVCAVYVRCKECKSSTAAFTAMIERCALDDAVKAWNRRTIEAEPVKVAEFIEMSDKEKNEGYKRTGNHYDGLCSLCCSYMFDTDKFCAECGAKMKGGKD